MEIFSDHDLSNRANELVHEAEHGRLSIITQNGAPVFLALPFNEVLLRSGVRVSMAVSLFAERTIGLSQAAKIAGVCSSEMMNILAVNKVSMVDYTEEELRDELKQFTE